MLARPLMGNIPTAPSSSSKQARTKSIQKHSSAFPDKITGFYIKKQIKETRCRRIAWNHKRKMNLYTCRLKDDADLKQTEILHMLALCLQEHVGATMHCASRKHVRQLLRSQTFTTRYWTSALHTYKMFKENAPHRSSCPLRMHFFVVGKNDTSKQRLCTLTQQYKVQDTPVYGRFFRVLKRSIYSTHAA